MSTIITTSTTSTTGYKMLVTNEDGIVHEYDINATDPKNEAILKLPENPSNRKWLSSKKVIDAGGTLELTYKESVKIGERSPKKQLLDFLTEEELNAMKQAEAYIEKMMSIARERKEEARQKPLTEKEKAQKKLDKAIEGLKALGVSDEEIQAILARN